MAKGQPQTSHQRALPSTEKKMNSARPTRFSMGMKIVFNYSMKNTVVEFEEGRRIAWRHFGNHIWRYTLTPVPGGTEVTETFDWAPARIPAMIERQGYPTKHPVAMAKTLERLDTYVTTGEVPASQP
jgi:hypothetical protein